MVFHAGHFCLWGYFLVSVVLANDSKNDSFVSYHVNKVSSCEVKIDNYGYVNLKPLQRTDGFPRFSAYYKNNDGYESAAWNYSFNPCIPFNEPRDPSTNRIFGEPCLYVAVCKFNKESERYFSYVYGNPASASFSFNIQKSLVTLSFNGSGGNANKKTHIRLVCDRSLQNAEDAVFKILSDNLRYGITTELRHLCCCPDACINGLPTVKSGSTQNTQTKTAASTTATTVKPGSIQNTPTKTEASTTATSVKPDFISPDSSNSSLRDEVEVINTQKKKPESTTLLLIVGLNIGLLLMAGIIGLMCYTKRSAGSPQFYSKIPAVQANPSSHLNFSKIDLEKDALEMPSSFKSSIRDYEPLSVRKKQLIMPVFDDCIIPTENIELAQRLGGGIYGDTYVGDVKGLKVAVTRITLNIHKNQVTADTLKWLKDEVWFLSRQRHRNIIAMLGICTDSKFPYILSEFIEGYTVKSYIQNKGDLVSWPLRVKILLQAADGVAYLHSTKPPIIHRDLRCGNIFISDHEIVKVGDFGIVKLIRPLRSVCTQDDCCCQGKFCACPSSLRWTAPEILNNPSSVEADGFISVKSDVYSFGMVMWELVMCEDPFDDIHTLQEVMELVKEGIRPKISENVMPQYKVLMNQCWNGDPGNRPSFKQIATKLKELVSPARTFQKNIISKMKMQRLQHDVDVSDSESSKKDRVISRTRYDSDNDSDSISSMTRTSKKKLQKLLQEVDGSERESSIKGSISSSILISRSRNNSESVNVNNDNDSISSSTRPRQGSLLKKTVDFKEDVMNSQKA